MGSIFKLCGDNSMEIGRSGNHCDACAETSMGSRIGMYLSLHFPLSVSDGVRYISSPLCRRGEKLSLLASSVLSVCTVYPVADGCLMTGRRWGNLLHSGGPLTTTR